MKNNKGKNLPSGPSYIGGDSPTTDAGPPGGVQFSTSPGFAAWLAMQGASLAVTSYQSSVLYFIGLNAQGSLHIHGTPLVKPMGIYSDTVGMLHVASGPRVLRFANILREGQRANGSFDTCFLPRLSWHLGALDTHDLIVGADGEPVVVATRYNCLAAPDPVHSFREVWRPPFISRLVAEDRCHLNGLTGRNGVPTHVTAISRSDTVDGWRDRRATGGLVVSVADNEVVTTGLSMPHSPRLDGDSLFLATSGTGEVGRISLSASSDCRFEPIAFCPGFVRGIAITRDALCVGLSKPRYNRFAGLALDDALRQSDSEPWCGLQVICRQTGRCLEWFRIDGAITELYDVALLPGTRSPMAVAPASEEAASLVTHASDLASIRGVPAAQSIEKSPEEKVAP